MALRIQGLCRPQYTLTTPSSLCLLNLWLSSFFTHYTNQVFWLKSPLAHELAHIRRWPLHLCERQAPFDALQVLPRDLITHDMTL